MNPVGFLYINLKKIHRTKDASLIQQKMKLSVSMQKKNMMESKPSEEANMSLQM